MTIASFHQVAAKDFSDRCGICLDDLLNGKNVVVHEGQGLLHPMHLECVKKTLQQLNVCPFCQVEVDNNSVLSLKDRIIKQLKE